MSVSCGPKPAARGRPDGARLLPRHVWRLKNNALRKAVSSLDLDFAGGEIQHLNHDFVLRARIVRIDDAHAVGDEQPALERRAASGKNSQKMPGRYLDNETSPDERHATGRNREVVCGSQVEPCCFIGGVRRKRNRGT